MQRQQCRRHLDGVGEIGAARVAFGMAKPATRQAAFAQGSGLVAERDGELVGTTLSGYTQATADALHAPAGYMRAVMTAEPVPNPPQPATTPGGNLP